MKSLFTLFLLCLGFTQDAFSYIVAVPRGQGTLNFSQPTRILVSGRGTDLSTQPQLSALSAAKLYKINFPEEQLVLISVLERRKLGGGKEDNGDANRALLLRAGWTFIVDNNEKFETKSATNEILKFSRIRSLEFWGHNSAHLGVQTDGLGYRFDFRDPIMKEITPLFDRGAFASIHGCNGGWIIAQQMSALWNIPFSAAFTETQFENLHSDGHFYVYAQSSAPNMSWATSNPDVKANDCANGGCLRMRPDDRRYIGKWGDFAGPFLNHYKFFCHLDEKECEKRMALSLYGFVAEKSLKQNSTYEDFQRVAKEYLCPLSIDRAITNNCFKQLDLVAQGKADRTKFYEETTSYEADPKNAQLACSLKSCKAKIVCDDHTCKLSERVGKGSTTLSDEYIHLLRGFKFLQAEGL